MAEKAQITFEVDKGLLFDMLHKMGGDTGPLGNRLVEQLLLDGTSLRDGIGMGVYGVSVVSRSSTTNPSTQPE